MIKSEYFLDDLKNNKFSKLLIRLLTYAFYLTGFFSVFTYRQLFNDGARWLYSIIRESSFNIDTPFWRYSSGIIQIPTVIMSRYNFDTTLITWVFCFSYYVYPVVVMLFIQHVILKKNFQDLYYLVCAIFFICIIPSWILSVSVVNEAICLSLLLFTYILTREKLKIYIIVPLVIILCLSYELGIFSLVSLLYVLHREKKSNSTLFAIFSIAILFQFFNIILRILPNHAQATYVESISANHLSWQLFNALVFIAILIFFYFISKLKNKNIYYFLFFILIMAYLIFQRIAPSYDYLNWKIHFDRTWTIPVSALLQIVGYEILKKNAFKFKTEQLILILIFGISAFSKDFVLTKNHYFFKNKISSMVDDSTGCRLMTKEEFDYIYEKDGLGDPAFIPLISILYQGPSIKNPRTILFSPMNNLDGMALERFPCKNIPPKHIFTVTNKYWSMDVPLTKKMKFNHIVPTE